MIELRIHTSRDVLPDCDYVYDNTDKLFELINVLTPKFKGQWVIVLLEPKIRFVNELIENQTLPEWVDFIVLMSRAKVNEITMNYPAYAPKVKTSKDVINEALTKVNNLVDVKAKKLLQKAYGTNARDLEETLTKLDKECTTGVITLKQVKSVVTYTKRLYASDVMNAFLTKDYRRWQLYDTLVHDLGMRHAFYALYSYVRKVLEAKNDYLQNEDVKQNIVKRVDAPFICYVYVLFANATNCDQLRGIMQSVDDRCPESVERIQNVNF